VIEARLDRLGQKNRALLATAAVIGRSFSASLLEEISDASVEEIVRSIELWCRRGLVREREDGYIFAHEKIREAAQANLSHARGKYTYRRVADVLKDAFPPLNPATLAQYYARSDQPLKALPYLTRAGEQALRLRSYQEARQFGLRAVGLLGRMPSPSKRSQRIDLNLQLAQAYAFTGEVSHALEILSEAEQLAASLDDKTRKAKVFHRLSQYYWLRGQTEVAGDYARRALRVAEEIEDPQLIYGALRMVGRVSIALSAFDDAIAYLERYVRPMNSASPPGLSVVCGYLGVAYARVGSWRRAREAARRGLSNAEADGASQAVDFARMQLAFIDADQQNWRSCLRVLEPVGDLLEGEGDLTPHGFMLLGLRGRALAHIGEPGRGIETILPALDWAERSDYRVFHYLPRIFLAECYLLDQQLQKAQREAKKALRDSRQAGNRWATGITLRLLSEVHARMPNPDWQSMESNLIESMHLLRQIRARPDLARTYLALRRLYDRAGQIAWAVDCHFRASTIFEELRMAKELSQAQGQAAGERDGAVVVPDVQLRGPNLPLQKSDL
jgi:tetratricopeptide (TPR) repeat protein